MAENRERYIPALHFRWLTPVYDAVLKRGMREERLKRCLIAQAGIRPGHQVLDLGCGTGTLTILIKQTYPEAKVTGLDGDPEVLLMAEAKARQAGVDIAWERGLAYALPFEGHTFDRVLCSLMLHHLNGDQKRRAFAEVLRILRPSGDFHILDFGPPRHPIAWLQALIMNRLEETSDHFNGHIPRMLTEAGFTGVSEVTQVGSLFGPLSFYQSRKM